MSSRPPVVAIDANVILRHLLDDHEELSEKAAGIFQQVETGTLAVHCDPVTLAEVVWVLGRHYRQPNAQIAEALEPVLKSEGFLMPEKGCYVLALELFGRSVRHFGDACACAAALQRCEGRLYSFDRELSAVEGIERSETATGQRDA